MAMKIIYGVSMKSSGEKQQAALKKENGKE
jgi:hypothetical protein